MAVLRWLMAVLRWLMAVLKVAYEMIFFVSDIVAYKDYN